MAAKCQECDADLGFKDTGEFFCVWCEYFKLEKQIDAMSEALEKIISEGHSHNWDECCADEHMEIARKALQQSPRKRGGE